jgi:hypothetical protein
MKLFKKNKPLYSFAFAFSLVLHFFAFGYLYNNIQNEKTANSIVSQKNATKHSIPFETVKFITQKQLQEIKNLKNKQIVANELNGKKEVPKESRFAGEANQTFDRQTMAATNGAFKKAGLGNKNGAMNTEVSVEEPKSAPKKMASKIAAPKTLNLSDLGAIHITKAEDEEKIQAAALEEMKHKLTSES